MRRRILRCVIIFTSGSAVVVLDASLLRNAESTLAHHLGQSLPDFADGFATGGCPPFRGESALGRPGNRGSAWSERDCGGESLSLSTTRFAQGVVSRIFTVKDKPNPFFKANSGTLYVSSLAYAVYRSIGTVRYVQATRGSRGFLLMRDYDKENHDLSQISYKPLNLRVISENLKWL